MLFYCLCYKICPHKNTPRVKIYIWSRGRDIAKSIGGHLRNPMVNIFIFTIILYFAIKYPWKLLAFISWVPLMYRKTPANISSTIWFMKSYAPSPAKACKRWLFSLIILRADCITSRTSELPRRLRSSGSSGKNLGLPDVLYLQYKPYILGSCPVKFLGVL